MNDYPYCRHGRYVGGCGADYMCGACEMDWEDPTAQELLDELNANVDSLAVLDARIAEYVSLLPDEVNAEKIIAEVRKPHVIRLLAKAAEFESVLEACDGNLNDNEWLIRAHDKNVREFYAHERERERQRIADIEARRDEQERRERERDDIYHNRGW